ncbi:MAG: SelB domain-containing protein [Limisphaerales bacterium]
MQTRHYLLAAAGHEEPGRSALVNALMGTAPDSARLELTAPSAAGRPEGHFPVGMVNLPGHEDVAKDGDAAIGAIDAALIVVAADAGWMPQTEEHLQILACLGVTRAVVALTQVELVAGRESAVTDAVRQQLAGSPFADAPIIPTSVESGQGLAELRLALATLFADAPPPRDPGQPRLPVEPVHTVEVVLERSARLAGSTAPTGKPLKDRAQVRIHSGSTRAPALLFLRDQAELLPGARGFAQLRFASPVLLFDGDRFLVRDDTEPSTLLAGGVVLELEGDRKRWNSLSRKIYLVRRATDPGNTQLAIEARLQRDQVVRRDRLFRQSRFTDAELTAAVDRLVGEGKAMAAGEVIAETDWWHRLIGQAAAAIDFNHLHHSEQPGMLLAELRRRLDDSLAVPGTFDALVDALGRIGYPRTGTTIAAATHRPSLPPRLAAAAAWLREAFAEKPLEPPSRRDFANDPVTQQTISFLIDTGELIEVGPDILLTRQAYLDLVASIRTYLRQYRQGTVSDLRRAARSSRRIVIPLLEKLDREGVTLRAGDARRLASQG